MLHVPAACPATTGQAAADAAARGHAGECVLERLLEAGELDAPERDGRMKVQAPL